MFNLVHDLDFADDLALITENINQAQILLSKLEEEAGQIGIICKAKKTEFQALILILKLNLRSHQEMEPI